MGKLFLHTTRTFQHEYRRYKHNFGVPVVGSRFTEICYGNSAIATFIRSRFDLAVDSIGKYLVISVR